MATHSSTLAWRLPRMEELVGYSPWGRKESDTTERLHFNFQTFCRASLVAQLVKNTPAMRETWDGSLGEGNGHPLQYCGLENPCTVHGVAKSQTRLRDFD